MPDQAVPVEAEFTLLRDHLKIRRRASERYRSRLATSGRLYIAGRSESELAWVRDLSLLGVSLLLPQRLEPGTALDIRIRSAQDNKLVERAARVIHSTPQANGEWVIGCEFAAPLSPEDLDDLL
jgi:hypothetical protein